MAEGEWITVTGAAAVVNARPVVELRYECRKESGF